MPTFHPVCDAFDLFDGEIKCAQLPDGTKVACYNLDGTYYVTDDTCTHEAASFSSEGVVEGANVICGWHACGFDIASGAATISPCSAPLRTYPVKVIDGVVNVVL